jgi:hypothetical protein
MAQPVAHPILPALPDAVATALTALAAAIEAAQEDEALAVRYGDPPTRALASRAAAHEARAAAEHAIRIALGNAVELGKREAR